MPDRATIEAQIEQLKTQLATIAADEAAARKAAIDAIPIEWVWSVEWINAHSAEIRKRWSDETIAAMDSLDAPKSSMTDWRKPNGMTYTLTCDNHLIAFSGGHVVLDAGRSFDKTGRLLTAEQIAQLRAGIVPVELHYVYKGY